MNQPSPAVSLALNTSWEPLRLARSRGALYGLFAVSIVGAASAPFFLVQRPASEKQGKQVTEPLLGAQTPVALAAAQLSGPEVSPPQLHDTLPTETLSNETLLSETSASGPQIFAPETSVQPGVTSAPQATVRIQQQSIAYAPLAARSFKPRPMAALLPEPAAYVARQVLPHTKDAALPMQASLPPAASMHPEPIAADPLPSLAGQVSTHESFPIQAEAPIPPAEPVAIVQPKTTDVIAQARAVEPAAVPEPVIEVAAASPMSTVAVPFVFPNDTVDLAALQYGGTVQMPVAAIAPEVDKAQVIATTSEDDEAQIIASASEDDKTPTIVAAPEGNKAQIIVAAPEGNKAQLIATGPQGNTAQILAPVPEDDKAHIIVAAASPGASRLAAMPAEPLLPQMPAVNEAPQFSPSVQTGLDEEVVVVAAASSSLTPTPQPELRIARSGDVVVVSAAPSSGAEPVNLETELRGLSLALSTRLGAANATLARAPELPKWAVMGEGKKLRLSH